MSVVSKNPYDLLGNDDGDSDTPAAPVKTVDKKTTRTVKRNTDGEAPSVRPPVTSSRRGGFAGSEAAPRDYGNRTRIPDDGARGGPRGGRDARGRGGRGATFRGSRDDRHTKGAPGGGSDKQAAQSWGAQEGEAEMKDEQAGEEIAKKDEKEAAVEDAEEVETPAEPEDKSISYADYLAQQAEKKLALESENSLKVRKANEGTKNNKQWAAAKPLVKEDDDDFIAGSGGKAKREREKKKKEFVELENRYIEPDRPRGGRGGRGGSTRGDSFRGGRSDRGDRGDTSRGGPRGGPRGGAPRGGAPRDGPPRGGAPRDGPPRGDFRGGRGGNTGNINPGDEKAFPSLGGK